MGIRLASTLVLLAAAFAARGADTLYATSLRGEAAGGAFIAGNLYTVEPATAAAKLIGPIRLGETEVGITAVASHPRTGVFYGITAGLSPAVPRSLVTVDLDSARASLVAPISMRGSDLAFGPDGTLYMWVPDAKRLVKLNPDNGAIEPLGPSGIEAGASGGLAIDRGGGKAYVAATGANGTLDSIDLETGKGTPGPKLTGAPFAVSIDNMTLSPSGVLYAVNSNGGAPSNAALVTIDVATGAVSQVGALPRDTRGLIFAPERARPSTWEEARKWILVALAVVALVLMGVAWKVR
ncbi:MAG TPA: hypothetical protein VHQ02_07325 [Usitatibacter sp.]|jgi:hypothetical protein|nr:hypothetical protein [Usitatibacter sp.]